MKYVYEFIGTFFLVLTVGMTVIGPNNAGLLAPLAIGSILAVMVYAGGHVSGGHYNPAVSLAAYLDNKLSVRNLWIYWVVQIVAGILAGWLTLYLKGRPYANPMELNVWRALISEFLFTFALCFVFLNVALARATKGNSFYGFAIGFTVLVGAYAVGAISGAAFNPAVAFGISVMRLSYWSNIWIFIVANLLGGACAAWVYKNTHRQQENLQ